MDLKSPIEYLKGVGPNRATLLKKELGIFTFGDLIHLYPYRYIDKTQFHKVKDLTANSGDVQLRGVMRRIETLGEGRKQRLVGKFRDDTGAIELIWFRGIYYVKNAFEVGKEYVIYGRVNDFNGKLNISHPEVEEVKPENTNAAETFAPVYASTDKLNQKKLDSKVRRKMVEAVFTKLTVADLPETLPDFLMQQLQLVPRWQALRSIHFPKSEQELHQAKRRLKFEELFFLQLRLLQLKRRRKGAIKGFVFENVGEHFMRFFKEKIPFELTGAQKRVIKEIRSDLGSGVHMNRLLQGDVGAGKTMVGLMCMLLALDNGFQAVMVAPTQILAQQHFDGIRRDLEGLDIVVEFLTGSIKGKKRKLLLERLASGEIDILVGTHAIFEDPVVFKNLGLAITDEQHRFGVKQRAKLWGKNKPNPPHVLVMTATPIPRTLAMTLYGDLDVSVIDELPPGRKPVTTVHRNDNHRMRVFGFMREEIAKGRQVYVVYPLIEESETLDLKNLEQGYEALSREFPLPDYSISIVHGKMKADDKEFEMQRFVKGETQIMIATTVIEVGVNVPNASVMVIEESQRFGLSQLHQLRGRVGRGAEQSFCILMTGFKLSKEGRERINTMVGSNDGFVISEADLRLRGPGNIEGTQQSGVLNLKIADLARDGRVLTAARNIATQILNEDPKLEKDIHARLKAHMAVVEAKIKGWSRIS